MERYNCDPPLFTERFLQRQETEKIVDQNLKRCLSLFDLVGQGIAHIVGGGIFIITPVAVATIAGPGLGFSYVLSSCIVLLTVLCYMDLGSRFECIGNAYVYVYTSIGEFPAILIATFMCSEMTLALPMIAHGVGQNLDAAFFNNSIHKAESEFINGITSTTVGDNIYVITLAVLIIAGGINLIGIKEVTAVNIVIIFLATGTLIMYCFLALVHGDIETFRNSTDPVSGRGGVFPFGWEGVLQGSAVSIVAYSGFETVAALAAEAKEPKRDIPRATFIAFVIVAILFTSVAFSIPYMSPWYKVSGSTGLADSLKETPHMTVPYYIIAVTVVLACFSSVLCNMTTVVRALYVVAFDGLLFKLFGAVAKSTQVPHYATIILTITASLLSIIFSFRQLIHMVSGGTLMIFTTVNITVIIISYRKAPLQEETPLVNNEVGQDSDGEGEDGDNYVIWLSLLYLVVISLGIIAFRIAVSLPMKIASLSVFLVLGLAILFFIWTKFERADNPNQSFICPLVPFIPGLAVISNLLLLSSLDTHALKMTGGYSIGGVVLYLSYGVWNSAITVKKQEVYRKVAEEEASEHGLDDGPGQ